MKHIVVHTNRELVLSEPLPDNVGVFFNTSTHTAKVFGTEKEAKDFEVILTRTGDDDQVQEGEQIPLDREGLLKFASEKNIPYDTSAPTAEIKQVVDKWIDGSNYPAMWGAGQQLAVNEVIQIDGTWYRVLQSHTTQLDWHPKITPALFVETSSPGEIPDWVQPTGAYDAYNIGDKVKFNGDTWESLINANVWAPGSVGAESLWKKL